MKSYQLASATTTGEILNISGSGRLNFLEFATDSSNANIGITVTVDGVASVLSLVAENPVAGIQHLDSSNNRSSRYCLYMPFEIYFKNTLVINISTGIVDEGSIVDYALD